MIQIGVLVHQSAFPHFRHIRSRWKQEIELHFYKFSNLKEVTALYLEKADHHDGILFSGELPYQIVKQSIGGSFSAPTAFLRITEGDFYKSLTTYAIRHQQIPYAEMYIDFLSAANSYYGLTDILAKDEQPLYIETNSYHESLYEEIYQNHCQLWKQNKIQLSVSRYNNVVNKLANKGYATLLIFPSTETIQETIEQFSRRILVDKLTNLQPALGVAAPVTAAKTELQQETEILKLQQELLSFNEEKQLGCLIRRFGSSIQIITSKAVLKEVTDAYCQCYLTAHLKQTLPFSVHLGWGTALSLEHAETEAYASFKAAMSHHEGCCCIKDGDKLIGPLGLTDSEEQFTPSASCSAEALELSREYGLSETTMQKLLTLTENLQTNKITSEEVAKHLHITQRSATRMLSKLEEKGGAKVSYQTRQQRGRPKKIYALQL